MSNADAFLIVGTHFGRALFYGIPLFCYFLVREELFESEVMVVGIVIYVVMVVHCWGVLI